jgi:hypothetical protein
VTRGRLQQARAWGRGAAALAVLASVALGAGVAGGPAQAAGTQVDQFGPTGMDINAAFSQYTQGDPNVTVAYVEGGINWHLSDAGALASVVSVNWHVTPVPCTGASVATATMVVGGVTQACHTVYSSSSADYDPDGSGVVDAAQWGSDPRVTDANRNGVVDPEDLIAAFCGPAWSPPSDPSGLHCPVSGWDFYDNQDDPATTDTAYGHANGQMDVIHRICPKCAILPVKAGEEALDPTDNLAKAWEFAAQEGARVIVSVTADLGYSPFARQVLDRLQAEGVEVVESSNDFDSSDHQGGMYWPGVIPGNGAVASPDGTAWVRSDETSWGPKAMFTVATGGGSTSESTPTTGAVLGLVLSYGDQAYADHRIPQPLTGPEAVQVLRATARPFTDTGLGWPGTNPTPGAPDDWNEQYGYGMPDVADAMGAIAAGQVPAAAAITGPDWYSTFDPTTTASVPVTGAVTAATGSTAFTASLEAAPGPQPAESAFIPVGTVSGTGSFAGSLGTLDLSTLPSSFWAAPYRLSSDQALSSAEQYDLTLRLVVTDSGGNVSEDRRVITVVHDPSLLPGYPKPIDPGSAGAGSAGATGTDARASGESAPQLADLQGTGHLDLVFGDTAGLVHAVDPATGAELPGWPVRTPAVADVPPLTGAFAGVDPGGQPVIEQVGVGDLFHTGQLDVVVTTLDGTVLAYDAGGHLLPGWPQAMDDGVSPPPVPRPAQPNVRHPTTVSGSPPVLVDLTGSNQLDVVVAGGDGELHAWTPEGAPVPGWPVRVSLPAADATPPPGYLLENDQTLEAAPTVAWLTAPRSAGGPPDIVERSQYSFIKGGGIQPLPFSFVFAYSPTGQLLKGWPARIQGSAEYYGSAQQYVTEGSTSTVAAPVGPGGTDAVADSPLWDTPVELTGSGSQAGSYGDTNAVLTQLLTIQGTGPSACPAGYAGADPPITFAASGAFGQVGGKLAFAQSGVGAHSFGCLEFPNLEQGLTEYQGAYPADASGNKATAELPGYPGPRQGDGFFTSPVIADVTGGGTAADAVIEGGDTSTVGATGPTGQEADGFPKFTSGWDLFAPSAGDLLANGHTDLVTTTREGYLYAWGTPGQAAADTQWWSARHDERNTADYGVDTRPPGALRQAAYTPATATAPGRLSFEAPGGDWYDGTVAAYRVTLAPSGVRLTVAPSGAAGTTQQVTLPAGTTGLTVQPVDGAGNLGPRAVFGTPPPPPDTASVLLAAADGGVFALGGAPYEGSMAGRALNAPVVGAAATPDGRGYWLAGADGGVFSFGDAPYLGSMAGRRLSAPVVGLAATPDGRGYWLVGADGAVYAFGDAPYEGSMAGRPLNAPVVALLPSASGGGYTLAAADGGLFALGDARFLGSGVGRLSGPVTAAAGTPDGGGVLLGSAAGQVVGLGDAVGVPPVVRNCPAGGCPPLGLAALVTTGDGLGAWAVGRSGTVLGSGDAAPLGLPAGLRLNAPVTAATG